MGDGFLPSCACRERVCDNNFVPGQQCCDSGHCTCITGHNHEIDIAIQWLQKLESRPLYAEESKEECCEMLDCILVSNLSNSIYIWKNVSSPMY